MKKAKLKRIIKALAPLFIWLLVLSLPFLSRLGGAAPEIRNDLFKNLFLSNILLIAIFYLHSYFIYPLREKKNGLTWYFILLITTMVIFIVADNYLHHEMPKFPRHDMPPPNPAFAVLPFTFVIVVSFCYRLYMDKVSREIHIKELETIHLKTELEFLFSQISPHFMFNVLNTLVSMARKKSDKMETSLISLSQLMRYMLYESNSGQITLEDEVAYLKSYIELQMLRFGEDVRINLNLSGAFDKYSIEPMLLIPFVENAFKHGIGALLEPVIDLSVQVDEQNKKLEMVVVNAIAPTSTQPLNAINKNTGIGLTNVKRRLELLYPEQHTLNINNSNNKFTAMLRIDL